MSRREVIDRIFQTLLALSIAVALGVALFGVQSWFGPRPAAAPVPHVASDCRAACTLEGMELAGVELSHNPPDARCLCAPIESSPGGDL